MHAGHLRRTGSFSAESFLIVAIFGAVFGAVILYFLNGKTEEITKAEAAWGDYPNQIMDGLMNGQQTEDKPFFQLPQLPQIKAPNWQLPQIPQFQTQQPQQSYEYQPEVRYPQPPCDDYQIDRNIYGPDEITCFY